jgi:hypothetical protein
MFKFPELNCEGFKKWNDQENGDEVDYLGIMFTEIENETVRIILR